MKNSHSLTFFIANTELVLDPDHAIYWPARETLFLTDLHLGKVGHFHKEGVAIPGQVVLDDYQRLDHLMQRYRIQHWICLGDLFHSHWNKEIPLFLDWRNQYPSVKFSLIEGNHDRYLRKHYDKLNIEIHETLELDSFYLIHDWTNHPIPSHLYALSGHLHPCVRLYGKGKQMLKLPCFFFKNQGAYLPAFGQFTGTHAVQPQASDRICVITQSKVIEINH